MTLTRNTVSKGMGGICMRQISTGRILYANLNSSYELSKTVDEGDAPQGVNSSGTKVDLDTPAQTVTFELAVATQKITRSINELMLDSQYALKSAYDLIPWSEVQTIASGSITLSGSSAPQTGTMFVSQLDGAKFTSTGSAPSAGEFKDNGDGTVTFNAADNGKIVVVTYKLDDKDVYVQGGADHTEVGDLDVHFYQVTGGSSVSGKVGVDLLWLPKCGLSGDSSLLFSEESQEKTFTLKPVVPDTPSGWVVPYQFIRDIEIDNSNSG